MTQMIKLVDMDIKIYYNIFHVFKKEESMSTMRKEMEDTKKTQTELLEGKTQISEMKTIWDGINRLDTNAEKVNELENTAIENIQNDIHGTSSVSSGTISSNMSYV